jgi:hypothetical protein
LMITVFNFWYFTNFSLPWFLFLIGQLLLQFLFGMCIFKDKPMSALYKN